MSNQVILCPTARLARQIRADIAQQQRQSGKQVTQAAPVFTLSQWLDETLENATLSGEMTSATPVRLSAFNEQTLWQRVVAQSLNKNILADLFDLSGLSEAAMEANRYVIAWKLPLPRDKMTEETHQFVLWQRAFQARCDKLNALETVRHLDWQLECLKNGAGQLPSSLAFAGFAQTAPQEQRLRDILTSRGVTVSEYLTTSPQPAQTQHIKLADQETECRATVAWALANHDKKLAIFTPNLDEVRNRLADLLDDAQIRDYNFSLGTPLAQQPIIQAALNLLRLFNGYQLAQSDISRLLVSPFWSACVSEADTRALLDARMREDLPAQIIMQSWLNYVEKTALTPRLLTDLKAAVAALQTNKQEASGWSHQFSTLLEALRWPGERSLTSTEYQITVNAWQKALDQLASLDLLGEKLSFNQALSALQRICTQQIFQPENTQTPRIQIMGMMEALSTPVDAAWVMGMNDHCWPPPARPNPLLPAEIQRNAKLPNADNHVQAAFATTIQQRILCSANAIIFSSSLADGESQLRASPLVKDMPSLETAPLAETLAEMLSKHKAEIEQLSDHISPAVQPGEHVRGGTGLFSAQAKCPAWAFYQYRLGATALKAPVNGLDAMTRGILVHDTLAHFWQKRHFSDLQTMSLEARQDEVRSAAGHALKELKNISHLSPTLLKLEQERLEKLVGGWLQFELDRGVEFDIIACEAEKSVLIGGIEVKLKIDRIHAENGSEYIFVDYKTGTKPAVAKWGEARITEPQLPIYACFYDANLQVSGLQFAMVKTADFAFSGISQADFDAEKRKGLAAKFENWSALQAHWKASIEAIASEISNGEASVIFTDENDLLYCEVTPLLRLPERALQFERFREAS